MPEIRLLPANDASNGWSRILPPRTATAPLVGDRRADWLVIGAGYAGLAAARRLAELRPNEKVVLLEAGEVGENASGRNSGFAIDLPHNAGHGFEELENSRGHMRLARAAIAHLDAAVARHDIRCNWSRRGNYHTAVSARGSAETLEPLARELESLGEPFRWLDATALRRDLGSPYYHSAVYTPGCVLMNPAALTRGLADSLPGAVRLHENSPVVRIDYANGVKATTSGGSVQAPRMILAVNGFAQEFGAYRGRLLPFKAHASLTRPLTEAERKAVGGVGDWGLTPADALVSTTMRYTQDHRLLIRHVIAYQPSFRVSAAALARVRARHRRVFRQRFPMLPDVSFDHSWTGFACLSRNSAPGFGPLSATVWTAVCCNGVGVTKSTIAGLLAADMACGEDNPLIADMERLGQPAPLPPRPLLDIGVHARNRFDLWRHRYEA
jgi:glycine/D-amino acid oxidase-like deaminating enzyme